MKNSIFWPLIIVIVIALGFFQEFVKVNINFTIEQGNRIPGFWEMSFADRETALYNASRHNPYDYYHSHTRIPFLNSLGVRQLGIMKWGLTLLFVALFFALNRWMIGRLIPDPRGKKWLMWTYIVTFCTALLIYMAGLPTAVPDLFYNISRKMVGALQSPIPAMMSWAAWRLYEQQHGNEATRRK